MARFESLTAPDFLTRSSILCRTYYGIVEPTLPDFCVLKVNCRYERFELAHEMSMRDEVRPKWVLVNGKLRDVSEFAHVRRENIDRLAVWIVKICATAATAANKLLRQNVT